MQINRKTLILYILFVTDESVISDWLIIKVSLVFICSDVTSCLGQRYTGLGAQTLTPKKHFSRFLSSGVLQQQKVHFTNLFKRVVNINCTLIDFLKSEVVCLTQYIFIHQISQYFIKMASKFYSCSYGLLNSTLL